MRPSGHLSLGELVDLEAALGLGRGAEVLSAETVEALVPKGAPTGRERTRLVRAWLEASFRSDTRPGDRLETAARGLTLGLVAGGLLAGAGAARYALSYEGMHPVNVVACLSLLVLPQIALTLLLGVNALVTRFATRGASDRALGFLHAGIIRLVRAKALAPRETPAAAAIDLGALYRPALSWRIFLAMQSFGVAFNVAALVTALALVTFTDLAFSWSTTLGVDAPAAHRFTAALAAPFSWIDPSLAPSLEVVEKTRYFRLDGRYAGAAEDPETLRRAVDLAATMAWWPFLAACLFTYGLLPRLVLAGYAWARTRRALARAPLEAYEVDRLLRAVSARAGGFHLRAGRDLTASRPQAPTPTVRAPVGEHAAAVVWRDAPYADDVVRRLIKEWHGGDAGPVLRAGGTAGDLDAAAAGGQLAAEGGTVYVVVDAFEALQKALARFLEGLRRRLGPRRLILLLPVEEREGAAVPPAAERHALWEKAARQLADPFLGVAERPVAGAPAGESSHE